MKSKIQKLLAVLGYKRKSAKQTADAFLRLNPEFPERIDEQYAGAATPMEEVDASSFALGTDEYSIGIQPGSPMVGNFYDLELSARQKLVAEAVATQETLVFRWEHLAAERTDSWSLRAKRAAQLIGSQASVVDLGCGMMTLEGFLNPTALYIPVDVVRRDERTLLVDLNKEDLPDFAADCLVGLGLLEYIFDVPKLLKRISTRYDTVLLSYSSVDNCPNRDERAGHAWLNHFSIAEMESMFLANGFRIHECVQHDALQTMWKLVSAKRIAALRSGELPRVKETNGVA